VNTLTRRLTVIYGEPDSIDPKAYLDEIEHLTEGFSDGVLKDAADDVIGSHRFKTWPTPAQCVNACKMAAERQATRQPVKRYVFPSKRGPYDAGTVATWERATAWRNSLPETHPLVKQGVAHAKAIAAMNREQFIQMQRESANRDLHRRKVTERSRRYGDDA
jgi:hypothetical protein